MIENIAPISENEIKFCEIWENVLLRKWDIPGNKIEECHKLLYGQGLTSRCPDCMRKTASNLNNYYKRILEKYNEYKSAKPEPIIEVVEPELILPEISEEELFTEKPKKLFRKKITDQ